MNAKTETNPPTAAEVTALMQRLADAESALKVHTGELDKSEAEYKKLETQNVRQAKLLEEQAGELEESEKHFDQLSTRVERLGNELDDSNAALEGAQTIIAARQKEWESGRSPEKTAQRYRQVVLRDLFRDRGMPATDHANLHNPDLSADEWEGTDAERKVLAPKIKKLLTHLKRNPQVHSVIAVKVGGEQ